MTGEGKMKLFDPEAESLPAEPPAPIEAVQEAPAPAGPRRPRGARKPRCIGCRVKAAEWPRDGRPVFCTRLCGYVMAVNLFRKQKTK